MFKETNIINPLDDPAWDHRVRSTQNYSFFHSASWAGVLRDAYGYRPLYFTWMDRGKIQALVPCMEIESVLTGKRGVSLPFTDYCDPLLEDEFSKENFHPLLHKLIAHGKNAAWKYVELRCAATLPRQFLPGCAYYGHMLDLSRKEEEIFSTFRESTRRNIRKAVKEGVQVGTYHSLDAVREFYRLHCLTRKEHGLPPPPFRFFEKIHEHVLSRDKGFVVLSSYGDTCIAGAVCFHFGEKAIYKFAASNKKFLSLRPNNLVLWEAIKRYTRNGYKRFCLGRTDPADEGLLRFKRGWGAEERTIRYYRYDIQRDAFVTRASRLSGGYNKIFHHLPGPLLKVAGSLLYKHMG